MLRFAPPDPHPESFDLFRDALEQLEVAPFRRVEALGYRLLWQLVSVLGFEPSLDACVVDGTPLPGTGPLPFSTREGGALCPSAPPSTARPNSRSRPGPIWPRCWTRRALPVLDAGTARPIAGCWPATSATTWLKVPSYPPWNSGLSGPGWRHDHRYRGPYRPREVGPGHRADRPGHGSSGGGATPGDHHRAQLRAARSGRRPGRGRG